MSSLMIGTFGHHLIPLLSSPEAAGALGGKAHLAAVKVACKSAERIHGALKLARRAEVAVVPGIPDFFDPAPVMAKARNLAWETIRTTPRLHWVLLTRFPEYIPTSLPSNWIGKGFRNVCMGYLAETHVNFAQKLDALRKAPVPLRMIHLWPSIPFIDLHGQFGGIDWVVVEGDSGGLPEVAKLKAECREANVAFLLHQPAGQSGSAATDVPGDAPPSPIHPFGAGVLLFQPTLSDLKPVPTSTPTLFPPPAMAEHSPDTSSAANLKINGSPVDPSPEPSAPAPPVGIVDSQVVHQSEIAVMDRVSAQTDINDGVYQKFVRLDEVVRRGLGTFREVGHALSEIRDGELWLAGGHTSWAAYCLAIGGLTKTHANRLIISSAVASHLAEVAPIGVTPTAESQVRPLCKLKKPEQQVLAWSLAAERAKGQPTARILSDVVAELMADGSLPSAPEPNRKHRIAEALGRLRASVTAKAPTEQINSLINELEKLLKMG